MVDPHGSWTRHLGHFEVRISRARFRELTNQWRWANSFLYVMARDGLLESNPDGWVLTDAGRKVLDRYLGVPNKGPAEATEGQPGVRK